jgi:hypothetical protein
MLLLAGNSMSKAGIIVSGGGAGSFPNSGKVFTVNPFAAAVRANRGLANTRKLRQSFKTTETFDVGEILFSFDVTGGNVAGSVNDTGIAVRIFEVADVNAATWTAGNLVKEIIYAQTLPGSTEYLRFQLSGSDRFTLPARSAGTTGYALEISTPNSLSTDGNPGVWYFTNDTAVADPYPNGSHFLDNNNRDLPRRDVGVVLRVPEPASAGLAILGMLGVIGLWLRRRGR